MIFDCHQDAFQHNWNDWLKGGPKAGGWTRSGQALSKPPLKLADMQVGEVEIEDILAKNSAETKRWHLSFLENHERPEQTPYWNEYLLPRMTADDARVRANRFIRLYETFSDNSVPFVWVADMATVDVPVEFKYFRFDGCHRACCAKMRGMKTLPALIFSLEKSAFLL